MKSDNKAKELTKSPFKGQDFNKVLELFLKIIDNVTKKTVNSELDNEIQIALEHELLKTTDPLQIWIKGTALEVLDYSNMAEKYKNKAIELGYSVSTVNENKKINLLESCIGKTIQLIKLHNNVENLSEGIKGIVESLDTETNILQVKWENGMKTPILPEDKFQLLLPMTGENQILPLKDEVNAGSTNSVTTTQLENEPEYNTSALIQLIASDAFYKFFYRELGDDADQDKNLEIFYKTYVKNDANVMKKLKTFESYINYLNEKGTL